MTQTLDELVADIRNGDQSGLRTPTPQPSREDVTLDDMVSSLRGRLEPEEAGPIGGFIEGYRQPERGLIYERAREGEITLPQAEQEIRFAGIEPEYKSPELSWNPLRLAKTALYMAGNFVGQLVGSLKEAAKDPATYAEIAAGAGIGSVGALGIGTVAGAGYGFGYAMFDQIRNQTQGNLFAEMVNNGVDEQTADTAAFVGGTLSAALEIAQFGTAGKFLAKGVGKVTEKAAQKAIAKAMTSRQTATQLAKIVGTQAIQAGGTEAAQEASQQFIEDLSKIFAEHVDGDVREKTTVYDALKNALQAGGETFLGAGLLGGLGAGVGTARGYGQYDTQRRFEVGAEKQKDGQEAGDGQLTEGYGEKGTAGELFQAQEGKISQDVYDAITNAQTKRGIADSVSEGIFGKKVKDLDDIQGSIVLKVLSSQDQNIEYTPLSYPNIEELTAQVSKDENINADTVKRAYIVPESTRMLAQVINNPDVSSGLREQASKLLGKITNRVKFTDTWLEETNSSLAKIMTEAQESSNSLALRKSLGQWKRDFVNGIGKKTQLQSYSKLRDTYAAISSVMPDWFNRYVGNLTNISTRLMSYLPVDMARDVFFDLNEAEVGKYAQKMKMVQPIEEDLNRFATAEANTPFVKFTIDDKHTDLSPNNVSMLYLISRMTDGKGNNRSDTGGIQVLLNHGLTEEDIQRIYNIMNLPEMAEYKKSAERIQSQMGEAWSPIATTYRNITGKTLGKKTVFYPVNFLEQIPDSEINDDTKIGSFGVVEEIDPKTGEVDKAFLKKAHNTNRRIANMSLFDSANRYFNDASHYLSFAPLMHDLKRVFDDGKFTKQLEDTIGKSEVRNLIREIDDIRSGGTRYSKGILDRVAHNIIGNMVRSVLAFPTVWVGQFSGALAAAGATRGGLMAIPRTVYNITSHPISALKEYTELVNSNPWFHNRAKSAQADFERQIFKDEKSAATLSTNRYLRNAQIAHKNIDRLAAKVTTFADLFANFVGYKAVANALEAQGLDASAASKEAIIALEKSQPTSATISKSYLFRARNTWIEMITRLKQQDNKSFNLILEAMYLMEEGYQVMPDGSLMKDKKKISEAKQLLMGQALNKIIWGASTALTGTMIATALGTTDDPEEKLKKSLTMKAVQSMTGALPGIDLAVEILTKAASSQQGGISMFLPTEPLVGAARGAYAVGGKALGMKTNISPGSVRDIGSIFGLPRALIEPIAAFTKDTKRSSRTRTPRRRRK